jgi:ABC-type multidrug transport system fused ATPase/permease subunit
MAMGEIVEMGTHDKLLLNKGYYSRLVNAQELTESKPDQEVNSALRSSTLNRVSSIKAKDKLNSYDIETGLAPERSTFSVMKEIGKLNSPEMKFTIPGLISAIGSGLIYPFFAISFGELIEIFSKVGDELTEEAIKWTLAFVAIAVSAFSFAFLQNTFFGIAAEYLIERIRKMAYSAILRQDIAFFDEEENSTGALTGNLANDAQQVKGVSGSILGALLQLSANLLGGAVVAFYFNWKMAAVGFSLMPIIISAGLLRMKILVFWF